MVVVYKTLLVEETIFKNTFEEVQINFESPAYTIVPTELFDDSSARLYLEQVTTLGNADKIGVDYLEKAQAKIIYAIDKGVQFLFEVHFPKSKINHALTAWLSAINTYTKSKRIKG